MAPSPSSSTTSTRSSETSESQNQDPRALLASLLKEEDEDVRLDCELKKHIAGVLERLTGGETDKAEIADFLLFCARSEADSRKKVAFALTCYLPFHFGDKQDDCNAAMKRLILSSIDVESLRELALATLLIFVAQKCDEPYEVIAGFLLLKFSATAKCFSGDREHLVACTLCCLVGLAAGVPKCVAGHLPAVAQIYCEAIEAAPPSVQSQCAAMLTLAANDCKAEIREAFEVVVTRAETCAPLLALALIRTAYAAVFTTVELTDFVGRCLRSSEAAVRDAAADAVGHLASHEEMGDEERAAAAVLLQQLLQMDDVGPVVKCLGQLARYAPVLFFANLPAVLAYCSKAVEAVIILNQVQQHQLAEVDRNDDVKEVIRVIKMIMGRLSGENMKAADSAVYDEVNKALQEWDEKEEAQGEKTEGKTHETSVSDGSSEKSEVEGI